MTTPFVHKKSLGQNFLQNLEVIRRSVEAGCLEPDDAVLEIGPGQGALTRLLLASSCRFIHAVEIDRRLAPWLLPLEENNSSRLRIYWTDSLKCDFTRLEPQPTKVLANIPYNITSELLWKIITELAPRGLKRIVLLIQKDAAERLRGAPRTKQRGPLGVTLEMMGSISSIMKVAPGSFVPPPKVWSEVILIEINQNKGLAADPVWIKILTSSFAQRRKKLFNNLRALLENENHLLDIFSAIGVNADARAEELAQGQWQALYTSLKDMI